jgi:hypothetical protein
MDVVKGSDGWWNDKTSVFLGLTAGGEERTGTVSSWTTAPASLVSFSLILAESVLSVEGV